MSSVADTAGDRRPTDLRVEYEPAPTNVDPTEPPRFSWRVSTDARGTRQTAYRIVVGHDRSAVGSGRGSLWDSGRVESSLSTNVPYDGPDLGSDTRYHWSVKLWTDEGETDWADPSAFVTALRPERWCGEWITHQPGAGDTNGWRSRWRSADESVEEWVQVDLGSSRRITAVDLHPSSPVTVVRTPDDVAVTRSWFDNPLDGFGFPNAYRIEVADDPRFESSTTVLEVDASDEADGEPPDDVPEETEPVRTHDGFEADGRYVRVTATDRFAFEPLAEESSHAQSAGRRTERVDAWQCFALAALEVRNGNEDLARGRPVEASSSVETDAWGRDHLANGRVASELAATSPLLRTEFALEEPVESVRAHLAAVGYGELHVNGERVCDHRLNPAWTDYEKRVCYSSYDLTDRVAVGENAIGVWLGRGWFSKGGAYWVPDGSPRARLVLTATFEDGSTRTIATDGDWRATASPIRENDIYDGELFDARLSEDGWRSPGFDDRDWDPASVVADPGGALRPQRVEPMRIVETFDVAEIHEHPDGPILDFGQNLTGWLEIEIRDPDEGDEITLRHAERLTEDGELSTTDLRSADATDVYVAAGADGERYEPRFTYHGFRYAQITGYPGGFDPDLVTAKVVHTAMDRRGTFSCSNEDLDRVQHNAVWGLRGNTHSVPEDCPQRDERFGWTGDAHISTRSLLFNFDAARFDEKWARDHDDVASEMGYVPDVIPNKASEDPADPTWSITRVMIPWYLYRHDGNERLLQEQYEGMRDYVEYWLSVAEDGILTDDYGKFGDWLAFENVDDRRGLPHDLYNTAFLYQVTDTFAKIAAVLENDADADAYRNRADRIADAFNERFFDADEAAYGPGTQSSYAVPLFLGLVPDSRVESVVANLVEKVEADGRTLKTGFLGTRPLLHTLTAHGHADVAYDVVSQPDRPGWVYMARNGATTMWERWDSDDRVGDGMNSFNHSPFTHVSEFFYEVLAGVRIGDRPVTDRVTVAPALVDDLSWVTASLETRNGELATEWRRDADAGSYELSVTIPWNTDATVRLPDAAEADVAESGSSLSAEETAGIESVREDGDSLVVELGSGTYEFAVR
ncbi:alpha-L-rhamnosidase [Haloterrigena salina JCM 13891]|uniref:alpha-L-rhamnosidase n=1 Tax=Haloterrigena salina JCM 13891 TaxID=1227488 RepID=M0CRZ6_9EURY|nr:family 78 glycoside hydrolase catalytic domain [Haloterrigena salina]ELZ24649.1 alpha-L-rhamnosidase [Haloterrigena salina JCM 13891]